jgi:hypothetical protein
MLAEIGQESNCGITQVRRIQNLWNETTLSSIERNLEGQIIKEKSHPVIRVAGVSILTAAGVVSRVVAAQRVHTARVRQQALVDI